MGAWGAQPFENDAASDWLLELGDGGTSVRATLEEALARDAAGEDLDSTAADEVVAALALVAMAGDATLRERWSDDAFEGECDVASALAATRGCRTRAARCVRLVARSDAAALWGDDEVWWGVLDDLSAALGAPRPRRERAHLRLVEPRAADTELVAELGLPRTPEWYYVTDEAGDVRRVPTGTASVDFDELGVVVARGAFVPHEDYHYWVEDSGDLVRCRVDPDLEQFLVVQFPSESSSDSRRPFLEYRRNATRRLEQLLQDLNDGADLEALARAVRAQAVGASFEVCTLADWRAWRQLGADGHRHAFAERIRELLAFFETLNG